MYISLKYMKEYLGILRLTKTVYENWNDMVEVGFGFGFAGWQMLIESSSL